jgi:hypothetical protein
MHLVERACIIVGDVQDAASGDARWPPVHELGTRHQNFCLRLLDLGERPLVGLVHLRHAPRRSCP